MALGIESNPIAPQLIQNSGQALVQGIREIGKQVSSHLTEIQTRRDLGALAQEFQGLNVQSNEFPTQFAELITRHPLAARDERAQMALSALQKAHGQWQTNQNFMERPVNVPGVGLMNRDGTVIRSTPVRPIAVSRNSRLVNPITKEVIIEPEALPAKAPSAAGARAQRNFDVGKLQAQLKLVDDQIKPLEKRFNQFNKEEEDFGPVGKLDDEQKNKLTVLYADRGKVGKQLEDLGAKQKALRNKINELLNAPLETAPAAPDLSLGGVVPQGQLADVTDPGILPPLPKADTYPPAQQTTTVIRRDPKTGKRYEVDITTKQVIREVP